MTAFLQPRFDQPSDYRVLIIAALKFEIVPRLTAAIGATLRYDSAPPSDVRGLDLEVKNALGLSF